MARQIALVALAMLVATNQAAVARSGSSTFLANGEDLRPDVVANTLVSVEDEWRKQAAVFTAENAPSDKKTPASFAKSCATVVSAVIQGSGGDRTVAKEYMSNVCGQKVLEGWHKLRCTSLATAITDKAMRADNYANRQMNPTKVCASFWSIFVEAEKNREAEEAKLRAEQEKIRAEEEKKQQAIRAEEAKKAAALKAEADKKAAAEAKVEAERRAKVEAEQQAEQAKVNAKREAEEAKARAAEAKARHEQLKAEAEKVQKEAQQKLEEAEKAEKEHQAMLAEHQKAEELLRDASKSAPKPAAGVVSDKVAADAATKPAAAAVTEKSAASAPKPAAKPASEAKVATAPAKVDAAAKAEPVAPAKSVETPEKAAAKVVAVTKPAFLEQDPCAGCDTALAQAYQTCASKHGNPCAETNEAGLVTSGPGTKKDIGCCMKKEKHDRCLQCSSMDCAHKTCNVNKKYYSTYTIVDKLDDKKAMKKSGWGL